MALGEADLDLGDFSAGEVDLDFGDSFPVGVLGEALFLNLGDGVLCS